MDGDSKYVRTDRMNNTMQHWDPKGKYSLKKKNEE
jgi:hypothetical protein